MLRFIHALSATVLASCVLASPVSVTNSNVRRFERRAVNDWSCKSTKHPNPVVLIHGASGNEVSTWTVVNPLLREQGFCTFALTYGVAPPPYPQFLGGIGSMEDSAHEIVGFIRQVQQRTGSDKVDLVGYSEGGVQALYVAKVLGLSPMIRNLVTIVPDTHGATIKGLVPLILEASGLSREQFGQIANAVGCGVCDGLATNGTIIRQLNDGRPIRQPGNDVTVIGTKFNEDPTSPEDIFLDEEGVHNMFVQDYCPLDTVGHIAAVYDPNVANLVLNSLENQVGRNFTCSLLPLPPLR